ncbi:MAG: hypothetical protein IT340_23380 [Chloroflexi bacterium]|nr:hypothetical protein [Chloroflexota bacterium]
MTAPASPTLASRHEQTPPSAWCAWLTVPRLFLLAGLAAVSIYAASVAILPRRYGHIIVGDGVYYYVYLRSLVHDGNLDFTDEYSEFNRVTTDAGKQINTTLRTPTGLALNMFAVGPAVVAAPLYLIAHALSLAGHAAGAPLPIDGYGLLYEGSFALAGVLASVAAAGCGYAAIRRRLPVGPALVGVAGIWLGGSLLYYTIASPVYAHAFSALGVAAWFLVWTRLNPRRLAPWLALGALGGLMATMRWQEGLFALLPAALWGWDVLRGRDSAAGALDLPVDTSQALVGPRWLALPAYSLGLALGFLPQMAAWQVLFGAPLAVPQGGAFFTWQEPHWLEVLLSPRNGLFTWTPVALLGIVGLALLLRHTPRWALVGLAAVALQVLVNGLLLDWWAGAAFGARRFIGGAVFLALGLGWLAALLWPARRRLAIGLVAVLIALNGLLVAQYSAFLKGWTPMDTYPTARQLTLDRFTWPFVLLLGRGSPGDNR